MYNRPKLVVAATGEQVLVGGHIADQRGTNWEFLEVSVHDGMVHVRDLDGVRNGRAFLPSVFPAYRVEA